MSNGMSFEEAKNRRDSLPAWKTFEESIKAGGVTGSVARAGGSALSGIRNRVVTRFSKGAKKSGQPVIRTTSNSRPSVTRNTMIDWAGIESVINRGLRGRGIARVKGTPSPQVFRGSTNYERLIAKRRAATRAKLKHGAKGSYHKPLGAGGEYSKGFRSTADWQRGTR